MSDVKQAASYIIELSSEANESDLTHLKLQKILYYVQVESLKQRGIKFFDAPIEAWQYGPVIPEVYEWLKPCGGYPITDFDVEIDSSALTDEDRSFLESMWRTYGIYSPFYLVQKTHAENEPWVNVFEDYKRLEIPPELMLDATTADEW